MEHVSNVLRCLKHDLECTRDNEVMAAQEALPQYIQDHNDKDAWKQVDRQVNALARSWDQMIQLLEKTIERAEKLESIPENFYGD